MSQVNAKLRRVEGGYAHWCPGCEEMHILDKNLEFPSFQPSFKHEGIQRVFINFKWTGKWKRDSAGNTIPYLCHYVLTAGKLNYQGDCTHKLNGQVVDLPVLPDWLTDEVL
jgi:hypothetical protein